MHAAFLLGLLALPDSGGWRLLYERGGFRAFEQAGSPPTYKAEGMVAMDLAEVAAVLTDLPRQREWVSHLAESRLLEGDPLGRHVAYSRFDLPWPVQDRDAVVEGVVTQLPREGKVHVRFRTVTHPAAPPRPDCLRVPYTEGSFTLTESSRGQIQVTYTVRLDPGGWLPDWLVRAFVKDAPYHTLRAFQTQVARTRGQYDAFIARERARWEQEKATR